MSLQENAHGNKVRISKFLREVKAEIKKVTWPTKKELQSYTGIVFITVGVMTVAIWVMDMVLGQIITLVIR